MIIIQKEVEHEGQILTTRNDLERTARSLCYHVPINTVWLLVNGIEGEEGKLRLYSICSELQMLSRLVYKSEDDFHKLEEKEYIRLIFEPLTETRDEVLRLIFNRVTTDINVAIVDHAFNCLKVLELLWGRALACKCELVFIHELAYDLEYVLLNKDNLVDPLFENGRDLFPSNLPDYDYNSGIALEFMNVEVV